MASPETARLRILRTSIRRTLVVAVWALIAGPTVALADQTSGDALTPRVAHQRAPHGVEDRVKLLSKALNLDADQQAEIAKLLTSQRDQVTKIWNDTNVAPAYRVVATQAVGDQTADKIRALLTEEQRKKYIQPRPQDGSNRSPPVNVEEWMKLKVQPAPSAAAVK